MIRSVRATLLMAVVAAAAALGPATITQAGPRTLLCKYDNGIPCEATSRPALIAFGGDGRTQGYHLRWRHWGRRAATATGRWRTNTASAEDPPKFTYARLRVTASGRKACSGARVYTKLTVHPAGQRSYTDHLSYKSC